jgi:hypothetical protein
MSTFNGFYLRANGKATLEAVREGFDQLEIEQHGDFIGVKLPPKQAPEEMLKRLSGMFETDVYWLGFESAMDCFEFHHWQSGQHVRALVYGMEEERIWERADGTPEPWERELFFHPKNLECDLDCAEDDEQREALQRVYRDGKIEVGLMGPGISSKETADAIAHHYGFPHYGLS